MFLSSLCLKTVFFKRSRNEIVVTHFFSCIIAEKKPKTQTHCGKWSWRIKNKDFWRIKMFSILLQEWEGWSRFCKRYSRNHGTVLISDGTPYLTQHAAPKRKDSALFLWQWPMTNGKKKSVWNINSIAGAVLVCYAAVLLGRHATFQSLWGERETTPRLNNAPMVGTTAQPSHEPPHERKQTGTRVTEKYQWGKNHREGDENDWETSWYG